MNYKYAYSNKRSIMICKNNSKYSHKHRTTDFIKVYHQSNDHYSLFSMYTIILLKLLFTNRIIKTKTN